jgi:hypothetical protein
MSMRAVLMGLAIGAAVALWLEHQKWAALAADPYPGTSGR